MWLWTAVGTTAAVLLLWAGTQLAKATGQSVEWYTGFGQWLGALGSLVAAVVALWISTTDRQRADRAQQDARDEAERDLAREAGLVRVTSGQFSALLAGVARGGTLPGIAVENRRNSRIYDIEYARIASHGVAIPDPTFLRYVKFRAGKAGDAQKIESLRVIGLEPDHLLTAYLTTSAENSAPPDEPPEYVAVRYTDQSGRRWEVDTDRGPGRKVS
ncbi:hypothetical protein C5E45_32760 [Nocardia nova]|uniref:Uncharacterized protein n=1 Tax=Nocardia nova TaxID=37330 RepID=A0A2S6ACP4_9NOCA|nr:hypothetical protein C5E45_32760 [Nocardia nova]